MFADAPAVDVKKPEQEPISMVEFSKPGHRGRCIKSLT
jgi:hypothetical protein